MSAAIPQGKLALSVPKAAAVLDCSADTIRKMVDRGDLRAIRLMGKVAIPVVELERICGVERAQPAPKELVEAFAKLLGVTEVAS